MQSPQIIRKADRRLQVRAAIIPILPIPTIPDPEPTCYGLWLRRRQRTKRGKKHFVIQKAGDSPKENSSPQREKEGEESNEGHIIISTPQQLIPGVVSPQKMDEQGNQQKRKEGEEKKEKEEFGQLTPLEAESQEPSFQQRLRDGEGEKEEGQIVAHKATEEISQKEKKEQKTFVWHCDEGDFILHRYYSGPFPYYKRYNYYKSYGIRSKTHRLPLT